MKFARRKTFAELRKIKFPTSVFDKSHTHQGSYDWGYLYPVFYEEASPGDTFRLSQQLVAKMMPTIAPIQHEINAFVHYYFVPYRILDDDWETIITGGRDGEDETPIPVWNPDAADKTVGSLWDHFGLPLTDCQDVEPIDYIRRAYNEINRNYYMDENITNLDDPSIDTNHALLKRYWEKDYFTVALPFQQRGIAPALPLIGHGIAQFAGIVGGGTHLFPLVFNGTASSARITGDRAALSSLVTDVKTAGNAGSAENDLPLGISADDLTDHNVVDLSTATAADIADIRTAFQIQRWMERNARSGVRYTEFLEAHFNEAPSDERLQRPEYIGGFRQPITITEVLQVSQTDVTAQGTRTGIGSVYGGGYVGSYHCQEYGIVMGLLSILPRTMYTQGVNRMWLRRTRYDFLFPEFANLSEQAIMKGEIFADANGAENVDIFAYQGKYDELRQTMSRAVGLLRKSTGGLIHWNLSRLFATRPGLNEDLITVETQDLKDRVFAVPSEPGFIITLGNICTVKRALPAIAEPGKLDHV